MRLWSLHPRHLDRAGLVAGWREALLAQAVLAGKTAGYRHHPQLLRFQQHSNPVGAVGAFLTGLHNEAVARGYSFDDSKIIERGEGIAPLLVSQGQLDYEWAHLGEKLARRSPSDAERWNLERPTPHGLFQVVPGEIEEWERP